jgi:hypothetical protein
MLGGTVNPDFVLTIAVILERADGDAAGHIT